MFIQDFFVSYYDYRPFRSILLNKIIGNGSKLSGFIGRRVLPWWFRCFRKEAKPLKSRASVVATMTSFPARIGNVWVVIESMLRQKLQPKQILLYLSEEQFPSRELPSSLDKYINDNFLRIIWVKDDYRSYKKFWYFIKEYPNEAFITLDDDIIYASDTVLKLVNEARKEKFTIPACYCYRIVYEDGFPGPYSKWSKKTNKGDCGLNVFFGSGGGTYFPVGSLVGADDNYEIIRQICPLADDIWLNAFIRKNGYSVVCVKDRRSVVNVLNKKNITLSKENVGAGRNDLQLKSTNRYLLSKGFENVWS